MVSRAPLLESRRDKWWGWKWRFRRQYHVIYETFTWPVAKYIFSTPLLIGYQKDLWKLVKLWRIQSDLWTCQVGANNNQHQQATISPRIFGQFQSFFFLNKQKHYTLHKMHTWYERWGGLLLKWEHSAWREYCEGRAQQGTFLYQTILVEKKPKIQLRTRICKHRQGVTREGNRPLPATCQ